MIATTHHPPFPPFIESMPRVPLSFEGLYGWIVKAEGWEIIFMEAERTVTIPRHHHGPQWGIVLDGSMKLITDHESRLYERGDTHFIAEGIEHEATPYAGWKGLYVFPHDSKPQIPKFGSK